MSKTTKIIISVIAIAIIGYVVGGLIVTFNGGTLDVFSVVPALPKNNDVALTSTKKISPNFQIQIDQAKASDVLETMVTFNLPDTQRLSELENKDFGAPDSESDPVGVKNWHNRVSENNNKITVIRQNRTVAKETIINELKKYGFKVKEDMEGWGDNIVLAEVPVKNIPQIVAHSGVALLDILAFRDPAFSSD
jgi:hypothetical protein